MRIQKVTKWTAPPTNGAALLTMPNLPKPLHSLAPRVIEGQAKWNLMRTKCYMDADYTCQACGKYLGAGHCEAHELYSIDYENHTSRFERAVTLCSFCHRFIHSGRTLTMYQRGEHGYSADLLLKNARHCLEVIRDYNLQHPDEKLRVYATFKDWLEDPELGKWLEPMFNQFEIEMYGPTSAGEDKKNWGKWRLLYNGKEYEPIYKTGKEWEEAMSK